MLRGILQARQRSLRSICICPADCYILRQSTQKSNLGPRQERYLPRRWQTSSAASSTVASEAVDMGAKRAAEEETQQQNGKRRKGSAPPPKIAESIVDESQYENQLEAKKRKVEALFKNMQLPTIEVFKSKKSHYRQRAEFRVWQSSDDLFYVMFTKRDVKGKKGQVLHEKERVNEFPVASEMINKLMNGVLEYIKERHTLRHKLFQANFLTTLSGEAMVTLVYHTALTDAWQEPAKELRKFLLELSGAKVLHLVGRSKNLKMELDKDFVLENMQVGDHSFIQKQVEGSFSQPNGEMCQNMLSWARDITKNTDGDLLELYCGNGNFTVALADNFREIVATEASKVSVNSARFNLEANGIKNVHIARVTSEEFTQAWRGEREFYRLKDFPDVRHRKFKTLLVDPPRAGLDDDTVNLLKTFDSAVYISCNPTTLHENLEKVQDSHTIQRFAIFDQFPYTEHIECGAYLIKKPV